MFASPTSSRLIVHVYMYFSTSLAPPVSAEELAKKQRLEHLRKEHMAALLHEGRESGTCVCMNGRSLHCFCYTFVAENCIKARLNLIKTKGLEVIKELKVMIIFVFNIYLIFTNFFSKLSIIRSKLEWAIIQAGQFCN